MAKQLSIDCERIDLPRRNSEAVSAFLFFLLMGSAQEPGGPPYLVTQSYDFFLSLAHVSLRVTVLLKTSFSFV